MSASRAYPFIEDDFGGVKAEGGIVLEKSFCDARRWRLVVDGFGAALADWSIDWKYSAAF